MKKSIGILAHLLTAPETQLDPSMVERLDKALRESTNEEELKNHLKDILDMCVHAGLASSFVMRVLDIEWRSLGGKPGDPVSDEVKKWQGS